MKDELKALIKEDKTDELKNKMEEINKKLHEITSKLYQQASQNNPQNKGKVSEDDVIDAEVVDEEEPKKKGKK